MATKAYLRSTDNVFFINKYTTLNKGSMQFIGMGQEVDGAFLVWALLVL